MDWIDKIMDNWYILFIGAVVLIYIIHKGYFKVFLQWLKDSDYTEHHVEGSNNRQFSGTNNQGINGDGNTIQSGGFNIQAKNVKIGLSAERKVHLTDFEKGILKDWVNSRKPDIYHELRNSMCIRYDFGNERKENIANAEQQAQIDEFIEHAKMMGYIVIDGKKTGKASGNITIYKLTKKAFTDFKNQ